MLDFLTTAFGQTSIWPVVFLLAVYFLAFMVKGLFGYGAVPMVIVAGSLVVPPHDAVVLAALVNVISQIVLIPDGLRDGDRKIALNCIVFMVPAVLLGVFLFRVLKPQGLEILAGGLILGLTLIDMTALRTKLLPENIGDIRFLGAGMSIIAGLLAGVVGAGAMLFLSVYLRRRLPEARQFRATVILIVTVMVVWRTLLLALSGFITGGVVLQAAIIIPVSGIAAQIGRSMAGKLSSQTYFRTYQIFLALMASLLILKAIISGHWQS